MEKLIMWDARINSKYEILEDDTVWLGTLKAHRIRALRDFGDVKEGDLGGYVESYMNLSHFGTAWIYPFASAWNQARVMGNAKVKGTSRLSDFAHVGGDAEVTDTVLRGEVTVEGNAEVRGVILKGDLVILGEAKVEYRRDVVYYSRVGSESGVLTAYRTKDNSIGVNRGCFEGSLGQFEEAVSKTYGVGLFANEYALEYQALVQAIKVRFNARKVNVPGLGNIYLCVDK